MKSRWRKNVVGVPELSAPSFHPELRRQRRLARGYQHSTPSELITKNIREPIITLVSQILSLKKENPAADTSVLERDIDALVYELYNLTDEEIKIIEGGSSPKD